MWGTELLRGRARELAANSRAANTLKAYETDMADFRVWCADQRPPLEALPAEPLTVALYVAALADVRKTSTIRRRLSALSVVHQLAGFDSPTSDAVVQAVWKGTRRTKGTAPVKKRAARTRVIASLVAPLGTSLADVRDRALLLMGFAGALRRPELVAIDVDDVAEDGDGLVVTIRRSKGDQEGIGEIRGLPYGGRPATCPVRAWRAWLEVSGITEGAAFRGVTRHGQLSTKRLSDRAIADMSSGVPSRRVLTATSLHILCVLASRPRHTRKARRNSQLCATVGGARRRRSCVATSKKAACGPTTRHSGSGCDGRNSTLATMCHMIHDSVTKPSTRPSSPDAATTCTVFCSCRSRRCSAGTRGSIHILMSLGCKQVTSGHSPPRISPELRESWTGAARSSLWKDDSTYRSSFAHRRDTPKISNPGAGRLTQPYAGGTPLVSSVCPEPVTHQHVQ